MNLSFAGCGFMGVYHLGAASCLQTYAPHILVNKISGASAGSCVALALLSGSAMGDLASTILEGCYAARKGTLGPFSPSFDPNAWLREGLGKALPEDGHLQLNGRLFVSLTRVYDGQNILVSQFNTREEVIQVIMASCFVPVFSGLIPPRYKGSRVIDGGYSNNLPKLDKDTITVSPFSGCADICPQTNDLENSLCVNLMPNTRVQLNKENFRRMFHVLLPPPPELVARYCKQGFDDTLRFLQSRYLISCTRCLGVASSYEIEEEVPTNIVACVEFDPECAECVKQRQEAGTGTVPLSVVKVFNKVFEEIDDQMIKENPLLKFICYPLMIVAHSFMWMLTHFSPKLSILVSNLVDYLSILVFGNQLASSPTSHKAKYTCEFNITQYGEDSMTDLAKYSDQKRRESVKDILNLGLVAHLESITPPNLPSSPEAAKKFQKENLTATVFSDSGVTSLVGSTFSSRRGSCTVSKMVSRVNSEDSLSELGGNLSGTIEQIKQVTDSQEAVMAFYYRDSPTEVKMLEIFDVTKTDPSLLVDQLDNILDSNSRRSSQETSRSNNSSSHSSDSPIVMTALPSFVSRAFINIDHGQIGPLVSASYQSPKCEDRQFEDAPDEDTDNEYFSAQENEECMVDSGMGRA